MSARLMMSAAERDRSASSRCTAKVPGQADSAPHRFDLKRHLVKAAVVGAVLTALYIANYFYGWIEVSDLDFYH